MTWCLTTEEIVTFNWRCVMKALITGFVLMELVVLGGLIGWALLELLCSIVNKSFLVTW